LDLILVSVLVAKKQSFDLGLELILNKVLFTLLILARYHNSRTIDRFHVK